MTRQEELQRLEFINSLKSIYNGALVRNELQAGSLVEVVFSDYYNLETTSGVGRLLSDFDAKIDAELMPEMYDYISTGMKSLSNMGAGHTTASVLNVMKDSAFDFMNIGDRLALDYITRVGSDGLRLSDRIWGADVKKAITQEVYEAVRLNEGKYELARRLEQFVSEKYPKFALDRIANTELTYAYSHARADAIIEEGSIFPNATSYIRISLSPAHPKSDICDAMAGTYLASEAPLPPFHPNCICIMETFLDFKDKKTNNIWQQFNKFSSMGLFNGGVIETVDSFVPAPISKTVTAPSLMLSDVSGVSYQEVIARWGATASNGSNISKISYRWDDVKNTDRMVIGESEWIMQIFPTLSDADKQRARNRLTELLSMISDTNRNQIEMVIRFI